MKEEICSKKKGKNVVKEVEEQETKEAEMMNTSDGVVIQLN
jgi:hypothetical protein